MKKLLIPLLLCLSLSVVSCGDKVPAQLPQTLAAADANLPAAAGKGLGILKGLSAMVVTIQSIEDIAARECVAAATATAAAQNCVVPPAIDAQFDALMLKYADASDAAGKKIVDGVKSYAELRQTLQPVVDSATTIYNFVNTLGALKTRLGAAFDKLRELASEAAGQFVFGGAQ